MFFKYLSLNTNASLDKAELQKSFEMLDIHYSRNGKGLWHYHKYDTPDKSGRYTKMSGYMLSADIIYRKEPVHRTVYGLHKELNVVALSQNKNRRGKNE